MKNFRVLEALPPKPPASGGCPQTDPPLRISGYVPDANAAFLCVFKLKRKIVCRGMQPVLFC